jgi:hypothetical protein
MIRISALFMFDIIEKEAFDRKGDDTSLPLLCFPSG